MSNPNPACVLAATWNIADAHAEMFNGRSLTAARWRHDFRELGDMVAPTNILFYRNRPTRAWRVRGRKSEQSTAKYKGIGLLGQGSYGSWQYLDYVDIVQIYVSNELLAELSIREDGPATVELRECSDLADPVLGILAEEVAGALDQPVQSSLYADSLGMTIAMRLLRMHSAKQSSSWNARSGGLAPWQILRSTEALAAQLGGEPSLDELAALVGLSKFHFLRAFRISIGVPPHRYLVDLRIARARELLESTDLSVTEIAARVGYDDPGYLARLFRRHVGTTPANYRRERGS